jgi:membrane protein implicated in regulation of membrane protease activity
MSFLRFLVAWANAPFSIAGGVALLFGILSLTGVLGLIAGGGDHDADADTDVDADAEVDADADGHGDHDHDHDADGGRGFGAFVLGGMGVGRLPFSIVWQTFALVFAFTGLALNARYLGGAVPLVSLAWTVPISAASAYGVVALLARLLGPVLSTKEVEATSRAQLVGQIGVVISSTVTKSFGEIRIKDRTGHDLRVVVKLAEGSRPVLEKEQVVVVEHDGASDTLYVTPLETDLPASSRKRRVAADLADGDPEDDAPLDRTRTAR